MLGLSVLASCSDKELFDQEAADHAKELQNAEAMLGTTIDKNHTWTMTEKKTVTVAQFPEGFVPSELYIYNADPLIDSTATVLAQTTNPKSAITFEAPTGYAQLYAVCIEQGTNDARVAAFDSNEKTVSFSDAKGYKFSTVASSRSAAPRKAPGNRADLNWQKTFHAKTFADTGWDDEWAYIEQGDAQIEFTDFKRYKNVALTFVPEGKLNYRDLIEKYDAIREYYYTVVDKDGGEVTVTPIWSDTGNPTPRIGYFYFEPGAEQNIKTVRKYIFEEPIPMNYHNVKDENIPDEQTIKSYKLIYYDAAGNPSYTFPKGTRIGFFNTVNNRYMSSMISEPFNWYGIGEANLELSNYFRDKGVNDATLGWNVGWETYSHTIMFQRDGENFIGFGDWIKDFDMNDILLLLTGDVEQLPVAELQEKKTHVYTYAFEDTRNGDYDVNDVVLRVTRTQGSKLNVELVAVGAADDLKVYYKPVSGDAVALFGGLEVHEAFKNASGVESMFYNTETVNATSFPSTVVTIDDHTFTFATADFYIVNLTKEIEVHTPASQGQVGLAPYGICVPNAWSWPIEKRCIVASYPYFKNFAQKAGANLDWYFYPAGGVITLP